jgi:hypothetical protein
MANPADSGDGPKEPEVREITVFSKTGGVTSPEYDFRVREVKPDPKAKQSVTESAKPSVSKTNQEELSGENQDQNVSVVKVNSEQLTKLQQQISDSKTSPGSSNQPVEEKTQSSGSPSATTPKQQTGQS